MQDTLEDSWRKLKEYIEGCIRDHQDTVNAETAKIKALRDTRSIMNTLTSFREEKIS